MLFDVWGTGYDSALLQALFSDNWLRVLPK